MLKIPLYVAIVLRNCRIKILLAMKGNVAEDHQITKESQMRHEKIL
jgi:hypothetical protein